MFRAVAPGDPEKERIQPDQVAGGYPILHVYVAIFPVPHLDPS